MRWERGRRSQNIEDRRGGGGRRAAGIGGGALILAILGALFFGGDMSSVLNQVVGGSGGGSILGGGSNTGGPVQETAGEKAAREFVSVVLADTEDTWHAVFKQAGTQYQPPKLVLYRGQVQSACGMNTSASGPFYCPGDYKVYLDLSFLNEMKQMGAGGDFALAYVVAHEVGHHVQNLIGTAGRVREMQARVSKKEANQLSVRMELQADCLAGIWTHHTQRRRQFLEEGDLEEAITAAAAVGDDHIQRQATGRVYPDSFTHGTSAQRMDWFKAGLKSGILDTCNSFQ